MKDKFSGKVMTRFVGLRAKTCSYLLDDGSGDKKARGTETCVVKRKPKFENNKTVQKQLNLIIKENIYNKIKLRQTVLKKIIKNS